MGFIRKATIIGSFGTARVAGVKGNSKKERNAEANEKMAKVEAKRFKAEQKAAKAEQRAAKVELHNLAKQVSNSDPNRWSSRGAPPDPASTTSRLVSGPGRQFVPTLVGRDPMDGFQRSFNVTQSCVCGSRRPSWKSGSNPVATRLRSKDSHPPKGRHPVLSLQVPCTAGCETHCEHSALSDLAALGPDASSRW